MKSQTTSVKPAPSILSPEQVLDQLKQYPDAYRLYLDLKQKDRQEFLDFCTGQTSLYLCYDTFFHYVFDADVHRNRVERMLSTILGQEIRIMEVLPREGSLMAETGSEIIVDLLVRLADGALVNLEIQKYGYRFPVERMDCYCADLIMREYNRLHNRYKKKFTYRHLHPVIAIVLMETSPEEFDTLPDIYIHRGQTTWDSGLELDGLALQIYICLDNFNRVMQNKDIITPLEAWLTVLTTQSPARIDELVRKYPDFGDIYHEIFEFRTRPEELIHMYSEALAAADRNMDRMMIDELREQAEQQAAELARQRQELADTNRALADRKQELADQKKALADSLEEISKLREEIRLLKSDH